MTEQEANTKRCCGPNGAGIYGNPDEQGVRERFCIGSSCMAWRHMRADWSAPNGIEDMTDVTGGFCGLAGKP